MHGDWNKCDTNGGDYCTRNDRREEADHLAEVLADDEDEQSCHKDGAIDRRDAVCVADGDHRADGCECTAEHDGQSDAGELVFPYLEYGCNPAHHDVDGDQVGQLCGCEADGASDDERHDDCAGVHCEYMLETE